MSKIALTPNASGTGVFTISSPATNTDRTLTLPDEAGTVLVNGTTSNVGIGTSSPQGKFNVGGGRSNFGANSETYSIGLGYTQARVNSGQTYYIGATDSATPDLVFSNAAGTERMRIDSSGNVGIGTSSPTSRLMANVSQTSSVADLLTLRDASTGNTINFQYFGDPTYGTAARFNWTGGYLAFRDGTTERMRIDSSGRVLIGTTVALGQGGLTFTPSATGVACVWDRVATAANTVAASYRNGGTQVGYIQYSNTATTYSTSSDYRLKTDAQPMTGASARVQALNPVNFAWIVDGSRVDGFLAHEAQEIVPECVTGTKDAMRDEEYEVTAAVYEDIIIAAVLDEEGNELEAERTEQRLVTEAVMGTRSVPDYQGIDQSKLVPLLTAALQEALNKIEAMETRLAALEAV